MPGIVIVVARNNLHLTRRAVLSAQCQDLPEVQVLLVDNASTDGTPEWTVSRALPTIAFTQQQSLAGCWNTALRVAFKLSPHALVINNDIVLCPDTYRKLLGYEVDFVSAVNVDSPDQAGRPSGDPPGELRPNPNFSCFLIRESVPARVGWFDEDYFPAYAEDCDYHVRMHRAGITAWCAPLPCLHVGAATLASADPAEARRIQRGADRNRARFHAKYGCYPGSPGYARLFEPTPASG